MENQKWLQIRLNLTISWEIDVKIEECLILVLVHNHLNVLIDIEGIDDGELVRNRDLWNQN
jgi:hypothetical protein